MCIKMSNNKMFKADFSITSVWFQHHQTLVSSPPASGCVTTRLWFRHHQRLVVSSPDAGGMTTGRWWRDNRMLVVR